MAASNENAVVGPEFCIWSKEVLEVFEDLGCCGEPDMSVRHASTNAALFSSATHTGVFSLSIHVLRDHHDNVLLSAKRTKGFSCGYQFDVYRGKSAQLLFHVRRSTGWNNNELHIYLPNKNPKRDIPDYNLKTNAFSESMTIYKQGRVVAKSDPPRNLLGNLRCDGVKIIVKCFNSNKGPPISNSNTSQCNTQGSSRGSRCPQGHFHPKNYGNRLVFVSGKASNSTHNSIQKRKGAIVVEDCNPTAKKLLFD